MRRRNSQDQAFGKQGADQRHYAAAQKSGIEAQVTFARWRWLVRAMFASVSLLLLIVLVIVVGRDQRLQVAELSPRRLAYTDAAAAMDYYALKRAPAGPRDVLPGLLCNDTEMSGEVRPLRSHRLAQ